MHSVLYTRCTMKSDKTMTVTRDATHENRAGKPHQEMPQEHSNTRTQYLTISKKATKRGVDSPQGMANRWEQLFSKTPTQDLALKVKSFNLGMHGIFRHRHRLRAVLLAHKGANTTWNTTRDVRCAQIKANITLQNPSTRPTPPLPSPLQRMSHGRPSFIQYGMWLQQVLHFSNIQTEEELFLLSCACLKQPPCVLYFGPGPGRVTGPAAALHSGTASALLFAFEPPHYRRHLHGKQQYLS